MSQISYRERIEQLEKTINDIKSKKMFNEIALQIKEMEDQILLLCEAHENDLIFMNNLLEQIEGLQNDINIIKDAINNQKVK